MTASWRGPCRAVSTGSATGRPPPQRVVDATEEYFEAEDALGRWLDERCVREANAKSLDRRTVQRLETGPSAGEFVGAQRRFSDLLITRGLENGATGMGVRGFQGIGLKHPPTRLHPIRGQLTP